MTDNKPDKSRLPVGTVETLAALVHYADGSIVSRTLINHPSGSLTLFAFDEGQNLSEHTAPFDAVVQVLDGEGSFTIGGENMTATAGQVVLMPADIPHAVDAISRFKMLLTMLKASA